MPKYGFSLTRIFPYKENIEEPFRNTGKYGSEKNRILASFMQCLLSKFDLLNFSKTLEAIIWLYGKEQSICDNIESIVDTL